ncbi:MAG: ATP-binding protein [Sandaracinaceae bacterium]
MSNARELAFRAAVLLAVASGLVAGAAAVGERGTATLVATACAAAATAIYLVAAIALRSGRGLAVVANGLAVPLALALAAWSHAHDSRSAAAAIGLAAVFSGLLARPIGAGLQGAVCTLVAVGVAVLAGFEPRWGVPVATVVVGAVGGVLLAVARGNAGASSPLGRALFSSLPMGVLIVDGGRIVRANPAIGALTRQKAAALVGLPVLHVIAPTDRERVEAYLTAPSQGPIDVHGRRDDGTLFDATITVAPLDTLLLVLIQDRSDRARAERAKDEFLSTVSHELRTPLASVQGALGLIEGGAAGAVSDKAGELVGLAKRNTERLLRLVNDILDLKRMESGRMRLRRRTIDPCESVRSALDGLAVIAADAGVELETAGSTEARLWADPDRVVQVLTNLVSNAIKFAPRGSAVTVRVATRARFVRFTVSDRGPGVPEGEQERLFSRFQQLDQSDSRAIQGSGLGLAIAKAIVRQHGGEIGLDTAGGAGEGATFFFELPIADPTADSAEMDSVAARPLDSVP